MTPDEPKFEKFEVRNCRHMDREHRHHMWDYAGVWIFCRGNEDASQFDRDPEPCLQCAPANVADILSAHRLVLADGAKRARCHCGFRPVGMVRSDHEAHVARALDAVICNGGTRPLVMPCARCGMSAVYNPRPGEDLVVCGDCGYEMGRDAMRSRVFEWRDSWFVAGDDDDSLTALRAALDGAA